MTRSLLLAAALLAVFAPSASASSVRLGQEGRWITDGAGRVVVLHGVNMVNKIQASGYAPDAIGFGDDDARFLARNGFNAVRLGLIWKAVEPQPGAYDDAYLARIERTYRTLRRHGIAVLLDFHQDMYNERFQGEGAPDWAVLGEAATEEPAPQVGFPFNYVVQPALNHAYDAFWANAEVPGTGRGVQDLFADAWAHVARRFAGRPGIVGYNLFNEPWPGSAFRAAINQGCATGPRSCGILAFEAGPLTAFHRRVVAAIRRVDARTTVWAAPLLVFDYGAESGSGTLDGPAGFAFNAYCAQASGIDALIPYLQGRPCSFPARLSFKNAEAVSRRTGQALLMTELGATDALADWRDYIRGADRHKVSWTYWAYWNTDPSGARPAEGLIHDIAGAPAGANVKSPKLRRLARPYPASTSGTPRRWRWNQGAHRFRLTYTPRRAGAGAGRPFPAGSVTRISVPRIHFPHGYRVTAAGARVVSKRGAPVLRVARCRGAVTVTVRIARGRTGAAARRC